MGGKGGASDNSAMINEMQSEAADAKAKEAARQVRLTQGLAAIKGAFEGTPVTKAVTTPYDWSKFTTPTPDPTGKGYVEPGGPAGYTPVRVPVQPATGAAGKPSTTGGGAVPRGVGNIAGSGRGYDAGGTTSGAASPAAYQWGLQDASGKTYAPGSALDITTQQPTGETQGGVSDQFYNDYKQKVLDYYQPQVDDQYKAATDELTYRLARAGISSSTQADKAFADLAKQKDVQDANIKNQADTALGDLKSKVSGEEQGAISQLYATEDPEVAANTAISNVRDISLSQPQTSVLGNLFQVADVGGANLLKGYQAGQFNQTFQNALNANRSHIAGTT